MNTVTDFLLALQYAETPDRDVDLAIAGMIDGWTAAPLYGLLIPVDQAGQPTPVPPYTASLDACRDLRDRTLPGWRAIMVEDTGTCRVRLESPDYVAESYSAGDETRTTVIAGADAVFNAKRLEHAFLGALITAIGATGSPLAPVS
jgi:hypothetical protein